MHRGEAEGTNERQLRARCGRRAAGAGAQQQMRVASYREPNEGGSKQTCFCCCATVAFFGTVDLRGSVGWNKYH